MCETKIVRRERHVKERTGREEEVGGGKEWLRYEEGEIEIVLVLGSV